MLEKIKIFVRNVNRNRLRGTFFIGILLGSLFGSLFNGALVVNSSLNLLLLVGYLLSARHLSFFKLRLAGNYLKRKYGGVGIGLAYIGFILSGVSLLFAPLSAIFLGAFLGGTIGVMMDPILNGCQAIMSFIQKILPERRKLSDSDLKRFNLTQIALLYGTSENVKNAQVEDLIDSKLFAIRFSQILQVVIRFASQNENTAKFEKFATTIKSLLNALDLNQMLVDGKTPLLHLAVQANGIKTSQLLLDLGADPSIPNDLAEYAFSSKLHDPQWNNFLIRHRQNFPSPHKVRSLSALALKAFHDVLDKKDKYQGKPLETILPEELLIKYRETAEREIKLQRHKKYYNEVVSKIPTLSQ